MANGPIGQRLRTSCSLLKPMRLSLLLLLFCAARAQAEQEDGFGEELLVRPLPDGHVLLHFHFLSVSRAGGVDHAALHSRGFPRRVAEVLSESRASSFALTLGRGTWEPDSWGEPPAPAPPGGAVSAVWHAGESEAAVQEGWQALTHGLGGLFCASLGQLAQPGEAFSPRASLGGAGTRRFGQLPREPVCTENLAPWLAALPCADAAGLAQLLRERGVSLGARYFSLALRADAGGGDGADAQAAQPRLQHTLSLVLAPPRHSHSTLSLASLARLGRGSAPWRPCVAAERSRVHFAVPTSSGWAPPQQQQQPLSQLQRGAWERLLSYDASLSGNASLAHLRLSLPGAPSTTRTGAAAPPLGVPRWSAAPPGAWRAASHLSGRGDSARGLVLELFRTELDHGDDGDTPGNNLTVTLLQILPHWCRPRFHTLRVSVDGAPAGLGAQSQVVPPRMRAPGLLDLQLSLAPAFRHLRLSLQFQVAHGRLDDFPADAQRGADLAPARFAVVTHSAAAAAACSEAQAALSPLLCALAGGRPGSGDAHQWVGEYSEAGSLPKRVVLYTSGLLLPLPSPDASMPFNVVCFVCTCVALLHASLLSALTERPGLAHRALKAEARIEAARAAAGGAPTRAGRLRAVARRWSGGGGGGTTDEKKES